MANEITGTLQLNVNKGGVAETLSGLISITMAGANIEKATQTIATSSTAVGLSALTGVPPCVLIKNLDTANYIEIDSASTFDKFPQKVPHGCTIILYPETATIYAKANTGAVQIQVMACEP